jgi:N-acetylglucosamine-6-phosphate deacetylase
MFDNRMMFVGRDFYRTARAELVHSGLLFDGVRLPTAHGLATGWLETSGTKIVGVGAGAPPAAAPRVTRIDGRGRTLLPGFVDVHTHGALGHEVMDADADGLAEMARFLARHGVTSFLATTWTAPPERTLAALESVAEAMRAPRPAGAARVLGAHMEGPYLNPERAGAQDPAHMRAPAPGELDRYLDVGVVRLMTVAPELPANAPVLDELRRRRITASAGHTDATYAQMVAAVERGVRHATHTYNAMRPLHHRDPGTVGACLTIDALRCEVIADGHHVDPVALDVLVRARGVGAVVLVSDAVRPTGLPEGVHQLDDRTVEVRDGAVRLQCGGLAGSVLTLDHALRNLAAATGVEPAALWPTASANAAQSAGVADRKGRLEPGLDADLVLLDADATVQATVVEGQPAYVGLGARELETV